jgi:hypothetical protein
METCLLGERRRLPQAPWNDASRVLGEFIQTSAVIGPTEDLAGEGRSRPYALHGMGGSRSTHTLTAPSKRRFSPPGHTWIAALSAAGILIHLILRYLIRTPAGFFETPLYVAVLADF